jgi:hypothetical protein
MLPTGVVGVIAVGVDGRVVASAKATIPFRATLIGQGVESGPIRPLIVRFKIPVSLPHAFVTLSVIVNAPGLVGMPEMVPVLGFIDRPCGRKLAVNVCGSVPFVLNVMGGEIGTPVYPSA